jgi:flagellar basal body P-ring protein FlgI
LLGSRIRFAAVIAFAAGSVALSAMPAYAQGKQKQDDVRKRGQVACGADVDKLCKELQPQGDMIVLQCLQKAKVELSGTCTKFLTEVGQLN